MKVYCTQHAVERFRERWAKGLTYPHARRELMILATGATRLKERSVNGQEQWLVNDGSGIILVMKRDPGQRGMICVTVLPDREVPADPMELAEPAEPGGAA